MILIVLLVRFEAYLWIPRHRCPLQRLYIKVFIHPFTLMEEWRRIQDSPVTLKSLGTIWGGFSRLLNTPGFGRTAPLLLCFHLQVVVDWPELWPLSFSSASSLCIWKHGLSVGSSPFCLPPHPLSPSLPPWPDCPPNQNISLLNLRGGGIIIFLYI